MSNEDSYNREYRETLLPAFLGEAQELFGEKTDYSLYKYITYETGKPPKVRYNRVVDAWQVQLNRAALYDKIDGIFQLSHEVVHLLAPVRVGDGSRNTNLEEGIAVFFSKVITERETADTQKFKTEMDRYPNYYAAFQLYEKLHNIDPRAVIKLRKLSPKFGDITEDHFFQSDIPAEKELIVELLSSFPEA